MLCDHLDLNVKIVSSGSEAIALLSGQHGFSLVLMDWSLSLSNDKAMDGLECARRIRRMEQGTCRHVPIVAVTARAMLGDRNRCLDSGMDDYLSKPFTCEQFLNKISPWISKQQRMIG